MNIIKKNTKRDIVKFDYKIRRAINLEHMQSISLVSNSIELDFINHSIYVTCDSDEEAKELYESLEEAWTGEESTSS